MLPRFPRATFPLLALALPSACTSPAANTSEGDSSTAVADDSSSTADSSASVTASTTDTTGPTSSTSSMTGNTMSTTDPSSSTGPQGCQGDDECAGPASPICIDQVCSPCESDAQCQAKDPTAPACRDDGQCVQCTASNDDGCLVLSAASLLCGAGMIEALCGRATSLPLVHGLADRYAWARASEVAEPGKVEWP